MCGFECVVCVVLCGLMCGFVWLNVWLCGKKNHTFVWLNVWFVWFCVVKCVVLNLMSTKYSLLTSRCIMDGSIKITHPMTQMIWTQAMLGASLANSMSWSHFGHEKLLPYVLYHFYSELLNRIQSAQLIWTD